MGIKRVNKSAFPSTEINDTYFEDKVDEEIIRDVKERRDKRLSYTYRVGVLHQDEFVCYFLVHSKKFTYQELNELFFGLMKENNDDFAEVIELMFNKHGFTGIYIESESIYRS